MFKSVEKGINYFLFAKKDNKPAVLDLGYHEKGCSVYPPGGINPEAVRKMLILAVDIGGASIKVGAAASMVFILAVGSAHVAQAFGQNDFPQVINEAQKMVIGFGEQALFFLTAHYLQKKLSPSTYRPGDFVPTKGNSFLKIIK